MRTIHSGGAAAACCLGAALLASGAHGADAPRDEVRAAASELALWLGGDANGQRWQDYLKLSQLQAELAKPGEADKLVVAAVLAQLESSAKGLELRQFAALRQSLRAWSDELNTPAAAELPNAARASKATFQPLGPDDTAAAVQSLKSAVDRLAAYLDRSGTTGAGWKQYLLWEPLAAQLQPGKQPDQAILRKVLDRLTADHAGLELPEFAAVRDAIEPLADLLEATTTPDLQARYQAELDALATALENHALKPTEASALAIGGRLRWLERMRQGRSLVRAVRVRHSHPNLFILAGRDVLAAGIERPIDEIGPVEDLILGTRIRGMGHTVGQVKLDLAPDVHRASLRTLLTGTVATTTVGHNGPAVIYSNGTTHISAAKWMTMDASGLSGYAASARASTYTDITGIGSSKGGLKGRIVQHVASRRAGASKGQAEQIAARHAEDRLRRRVDDEAGGMLAKAGDNYRLKFRHPLLRRREFPRQLDFATTADALLVTGLQADDSQLGAPTPPPPLSEQHGLIVRMHESLVNNLASALLAGQTLKEEDVQAKVIEWRGSLPDKLKSDEDRGPWSITFARAQPVTLAVNDGGFVLTIRGQRYTSGDEQFRSMNISATYKAAIHGNGSKLVRQGELEIFPPGFVPGKSRLSVGEISLKKLLEKKFGKLLEPEIVSEGLQLPGKWERAGKLTLKQLLADDGWLLMAWDKPATPPTPAVAAK